MNPTSSKGRSPWKVKMAGGSGGIVIPKGAVVVNQGLKKVKLEEDYVDQKPELTLLMDTKNDANLRTSTDAVSSGAEAFTEEYVVTKVEVDTSNILMSSGETPGPSEGNDHGSSSSWGEEIETVKCTVKQLTMLVEKQNDVIKKQDEMIKKQDEENKKQDEAIKKQDEAIKKQDKVLKKQDEAFKKQDEAIKKQDEVLKKQDEAIRKQDEAIKKQDKAIKKQDEAIKKQDEKFKKQDETVKKLDKAFKKQEKAFRKHAEAFKKQLEVFTNQDEAFKKQNEGITEMKSFLRSIGLSMATYFSDSTEAENGGRHDSKEESPGIDLETLLGRPDQSAENDKMSVDGEYVTGSNVQNGDDDPSSPGGYGTFPSDPTPSGYIWTPNETGRSGGTGTDIYGNPQTPRTMLDATKWQKAGIEVMIKDTHPVLGLRRQTGVIKNVLVGSSNCVVFLTQKERSTIVKRDQLVPTVPKAGDRVKIMGTDLDGAIGVLRTVDSGDGVVSVHGDIKFFPIFSLAKVVEIV